MEKLSGMDRANIRFYEREGFLSPPRLANGYREYSEEDLQILLRIKLLRSLRISLEEIKELQHKNKNLVETLSEQARKLERENQEVTDARAICLAIKEENVSFDRLDAKKYLAGEGISSSLVERHYEVPASDKLGQVFHPWRRYLARSFDLSLYSVLWASLLAFVFRVNLTTRGPGGNLLDTVVTILLLLVFEPLWLSVSGTTPGKAIFGLRLETSDGQKLSYGEAMERVIGVIGQGMGYMIPIYSWWRLWQSYKRCTEGENQPWDYDLTYLIQDTKARRGVYYFAALALLFAVLVLVFAAQLLPPKRGSLTVAEFAENYRYYQRYFGVDEGNFVLDDQGQWVEKENSGSYYISLGYEERPEFSFSLEGDRVAAVSFAIEAEFTGDEEAWVASYDDVMFLSSLALAGAEEEVGLFSGVPERIASLIEQNRFRDFHFSEAGLEISSTCTYQGFEDMGFDFLFPEEDAEAYTFALRFQVGKE